MVLVPQQALLSESQADMPIPREFLEYARGYPILLEGLFAKETDRLRRAPEVQQWFAQNMPNATPQERDTRIQQQAAQNAQQLGKKAFEERRQKLGVKSFTQQDLHEAVAAARNETADKIASDPRVMRAADGLVDTAKMEAEYRGKIVPADIDREFSALSRYLPFDVPELKPQKAPGKPIESAAKQEGAPKPAAPSQPDDPVLRGVVGIMKDPAAAAEEQQKKKTAQTPSPNTTA